MKRWILSLFVWCLALGVLAADAQRPNVVLVMADDMGWSDVGCYGGEIKTPHIDALASGGLRFTQFYNNAICGPTRASLLTGLYCQQVGHRGDRWNEPRDYSKCVLISEMLQQANYRTMMVGKWQGRDSPLDRGFDRFFGPMCQGKISYFHEVQLNPYFLDRQRWTVPHDFYLTDAINQHALTFLKEATHGDKPFFLYVAHIAPHWPLHAREQDIEPQRATYRALGWDDCRQNRFQAQRKLGVIPETWKLSPRPEGVGDWKSEAQREWQAERMAVYAAQVASIDRGVGQLLEVLRATGKLNNTLFLFLSDNGAAPDGGLKPTPNGFGFSADKPTPWRTDKVAIQPGSGPQNMPGPPHTFAGYGLAWANVSNTPFRGTKSTGYEGGIRTPLIAHWPNTIAAGKQTPVVGHVIDLMPTCLDLAAVAYPTEFHSRQPLPLEGKSLLPLFHGKPRADHEALCWSVPQHQAIRMGNWKAVRPRNGTWQLFQLETDATETHDLSTEHPSRVEELARQFDLWKTRVGAKE